MTFIDLIVSSDITYSQDPEGYLRDFISAVETICSSGVRREILVHLLVERASCSSLLKVDLGLSHASVHRELRVLVGLGLIQRVVPRRSGRERPYAIYAVNGYSADDIVRVTERVSRLRTPAYSRVRVISQLILDEYLEPRGLREITMREIMDETRAKCKGYYSGDIARLVAAELATEGIKVWR